MRRLSASKLQLAAHCLHWLRDDVEVEDSSKSSWSAKSGNAGHTAAEMVILSSGGAANIDAIARELSLTERQREILGAQHAEWLRWYEGQAQGVRDNMMADVPYALHDGQAWVLESKGHRDYSKAPPEAICGTADAVSMHDGVLRVWDWKFGRAYVPEPERNGQLRGLGLMAANVHGADSVHIGVVRVSEKDGVLDLGYTMDDFDLVGEGQHLRDIQRRMLPTVEATPGEHCQALYCPARKTCPHAVAKEVAA